MYRAALESILGLRKRGEMLHIDPCIPPGWPTFRISYRHGAATYEIRVDNPRGVARGVAQMKLDGTRIDSLSQGILLTDDALTHRVEVVLG
jgi:cyclic beta-1,2-glucan synthetase